MEAEVGLPLPASRRARLQRPAPSRFGPRASSHRSGSRKIETPSAPPDPAVQRIEPHAVDQFGGALDIPNREVAGLPRLQRADAVEAAERAGGFAGDAGQALVDGEAEQRGRHVHRQQQRGERRGARIAVGGDRDGNAVAAQQVDRRLVRLADEIEGAGQQHGHGAGLGQGRDARLVDIFQVIGRLRAEPRRQRRAVQVGELLGVQLHRQAVRPGGLKHARDLFRREADGLAEGIDRVGQARGGDGRQHVAADEIDIGVFVATSLGRHRMGAEEGRRHRERPDLAQPPRRLQRLHLSNALQAVARFYLKRGDAFGDQRIDARQGRRQQLVLARGPRRLHGRDDAAARPRQLLVGGAGQAQLELVRAVAAMDDVGVAIDQARRDPAAGAIDNVGRRIGGRVGLRAGIDDVAAVRGDQALVDEAEAARSWWRGVRSSRGDRLAWVGSSALGREAQQPHSTTGTKLKLQVQQEYARKPVMVAERSSATQPARPW